MDDDWSDEALERAWLEGERQILEWLDLPNMAADLKCSSSLAAEAEVIDTMAVELARLLSSP